METTNFELDLLTPAERGKGRARPQDVCRIHRHEGDGQTVAHLWPIG